MLKIAICDDSPLFLEQARSAVLKWSDENQISTKLYIYEIWQNHFILFY